MGWGTSHVACCAAAAVRCYIPLPRLVHEVTFALIACFAACSCLAGRGRLLPKQTHAKLLPLVRTP